MSDKALRRLAVSLFGLCAILTVATLAFTIVEFARGEVKIGTVDFLSGFIFLADGLVFAAVGTVIAQQQPRNTIGWLLLPVGVLWSLGLTLGIYADYGVNVAPGSVPAPALANALVDWTWVPAVGIMATFVPLLYPNGHLPSSRWRWLAWLSASVMVVLSLAFITDPHAFSDSSLDHVANPLAIDLPSWVRSVIEKVFVLFPLCMLASAVAAIGRYRRSNGIERLQMKWLVTAGAFFAAFFGGMLLLGTIPSVNNNATWTAVANFLLPITFMLFPLAIGAAVLRYRLYDIDVVISRSLVFGALASFITLVYVAVVVGIGHLFSSGNRPNLALSIAATAIVAVAFEPVRNRLQKFANRVVYGERATPYEVLSNFADRMGGAYDATELLPIMARTVGQGVDAVRTQVWLRRQDGLELAASWSSTEGPAPSRQVDRTSIESIECDRLTEVRDQGEVLGAIAVVKPAGKELTPVEDQLLETLAAQAGPVLRNVRLIEDLRSSRQRLVARQDDERRRLERNLHDGAQQSLVAVALMLRLLQPKVARENQRAGTSLEQAAAELGHAVEELRDLARGIYPAVLAERGLGAALASLAERSPIPAVVDDRTKARVSAEIERALYFITVEALTSSVEARASEVTIALEPSAGALTLSITDDGPPADDAVRGLALQRLLDRAAVVDAALTVDGVAAGLHLVCEVPVPEAASDVPGKQATVAAVPMGAGQ